MSDKTIKANATVIGVEHVNYTKGDRQVDFYNLHYAADQVTQDKSMRGQYAAVARTTADLTDIVEGSRVKLIFENDPKWKRSNLTEVIPC
jgi:hypothetical protein